MKPFGWAIIGPGRIAHRFAEAVQRSETARLVTVQGRDGTRAREFAAKWSTWSRDGSQVDVAAGMAALLADRRVDGVYIATPHAFHAEAIRQCLAARKPVLCEKPLVPNLEQGREVVALSRKHNAFLMEAVWTRFLPVYEIVGGWLREYAIGGVRAIQSSFCFNAPFDPGHRNYDPSQAGGALLDLGIYNLTMTRWVLQAAMGTCPPLASLEASSVIGPTGVDHRTAATLEFAGGVVSQFICAFDTNADNCLRIQGERGSIIVRNFWQGTDAELRVAGKDVVKVQRAFRVNGFEYEMGEAVGLIRRGAIESAVISHDETLATLEWMDRIRERVGVRYPFEQMQSAGKEPEHAR